MAALLPFLIVIMVALACIVFGLAVFVIGHVSHRTSWSMTHSKK